MGGSVRAESLIDDGNRAQWSSDIVLGSLRGIGGAQVVIPGVCLRLWTGGVGSVDILVKYNMCVVSPKLQRICNKWQRKCEEKYPKHYACRQFKRNCRSVDLQLHLNSTSDGNIRPANSSDEATESGEQEGGVKILEQCQQWKRTCAKKYPEHYTCRQYRRKCGFVDALANSSRNSTSVSPISTKSATHHLNTTTNKTSTDIDREADSENEESDSIELDS
ncbi:hypothetical protein OSTOST_09509 [Ostertagia ostertagi]